MFPIIVFILHIEHQPQNYNNMFFNVKDGKVYKHMNGSNSGMVVYSDSAKAVKALLSPDETKALILTQKGKLLLMDTKNLGKHQICGANGPVTDMAWDGNKTVMYKARSGNFLRSSI